MSLNTQAHYESHFEQHIIEQLQLQGWLYTPNNDGYNKEFALYAPDVVAWVQETQPEKWAKLQTMHGKEAEKHLLKSIHEMAERAALGNAQGMLEVLKEGVPTLGSGKIQMSQAKPEDHRNPTAQAFYDAHRLRVMNQVQYNPSRGWEIDLVLLVNGLPLATIELKTDFNQSVENAKQQYKTDRLPINPITRRQEPLLFAKRGAIVHFAMSESEIYMTTQLDGENTLFLPFNQGNDGHAGNPPSQNGEYPTAYFWQYICQKEHWLNIFHQFVYLEKKHSQDLSGKYSTKVRLIFPRFHQFDAVRKMITDVEQHGVGKNYLCEHSAGSGKTATITWTAHSLTRLREVNGTPLFNSVIVVTDRTVLDDQLQEAIQQLDHQQGLISVINRNQKEQVGKSKSKQLEEALLSNTPIIVVTIQTFPYAMEAILDSTSLAERHFAIIIDEAHNSQTGSSASKLQATLTSQSQQELSDVDLDEMLLQIQKSRGQSPNISHFAFTATPKHSTFMLFGRTKNDLPPSEENKPQAFHRYTMRQAIEEGFILDVLKGYVHYNTAYQIGEKVHHEEDKRVEEQSAKRAIARWQNLHPTNVTQKAQFILEHFHHNVVNLLNGKAKAMIVTSSRPAAMRYKIAIEELVKQNPIYQNYRVLVAFSGSLNGKDLRHYDDKGTIFNFNDETEFTEYNANNGITDLRQAFEGEEYRLMVVANKFQTGFDQPKLCAMYLDKKIGNEVEVVQTLSRLNRTFQGKDHVFIIDFVNDKKHILNSFKRYDSGAEISEPQDPKVLFDLKFTLDQSGIYSKAEVEQFKQIYFRSMQQMKANRQNENLHRKLYQATESIASRFNQRIHSLKENVDKWDHQVNVAHQSQDSDAENFAKMQLEEVDKALQSLLKLKSKLAQFNRWYVYLAQLVDYADPELENFAAFSKLLAKRLNSVPMQEVDVSGIMLTGYRIYKTKMNKPVVSEPTNEDYSLKPITGSGGAESKAKKRGYLSEILELISETFGDISTEEEQIIYINHITGILKKNETVMEQIQKNPQEVALQGNLSNALTNAIVQALSSYESLSSLLLGQDPKALENIKLAVYKLLKEGKELSRYSS